jgi:hypothetical protein
MQSPLHGCKYSSSSTKLHQFTEIKTTSEELKFFRIPDFHTYTILLEDQTECLSMSNLNKDEYIEVHNMNLDKLERVHRKEFLRSYPYELPCQSLFFALLHYQRIMDHSIKSVYRSELSSMSIKNIEFVHLSNIKNNFDSGCPDDDLISSFQRINSLGSMQMSGF